MTDPVIEDPAPSGPTSGSGLAGHDGQRAAEPLATAAPSGTRRRARLARETQRRRKHKSSGRNLIEWVVVLGGALLIAFVIRLVLFQAFYIPSASMRPTLMEQDRVVVNKRSYTFHDVHRKDIVVFQRPPGVDPKNKDLIKRVVGLPGETVSLQQGRVFINGRALDEPYVSPGTRSDALHFAECRVDLSRPLVIPKGDVFVMGDNRLQSLDSRCFGPIPTKLIVGRAFVRVWPLSRLSSL